MFDLQVLAFRAEITRVATMMYARDTSGAVYAPAGVRDGFHVASHHSNGRAAMDKFALINKYHVELLAYFLEKLKSTPDGDGNLLDHSMILYGSSMSNGNQHDHDPLPLILAGGASGKLEGVSHIKTAPHTPASNLAASMLNKLGVSRDRPTATAPAYWRSEHERKPPPGNDVIRRRCRRHGARANARGRIGTRKRNRSTGAGPAGKAAERHSKPSGPALPLKTTGLEHIGITVPNPEAMANFYGRIFDPQLFKERDIANRFYCRTGKAYLAFGTNATVTEPKIDHICALVEDYRAQDVRAALAAQGITMAAGPTGMPSDADGMRLQLLGVPGGLAGTIIPGGRISQDDAIVQAVGIDHVTQWVSNLDASTKFYATFFGKEASRSANKVVFKVAQTQLVLEKAPAGEAPRVHHFTVRLAGMEPQERRSQADRVGR